MPTLSQSNRFGSGSWADAFPSRAANLNDQFEEQSGLLDQYQFEGLFWLVDQSPWGQLEPDNARPNIWFLDFSFSSISASPEAVRLLRNLHVHGQGLETMIEATPRRISILDFPRLHLGTVLRPLGPNDDLLGEMLDEVRP